MVKVLKCPWQGLAGRELRRIWNRAVDGELLRELHEFPERKSRNIPPNFIGAAFADDYPLLLSEADIFPGDIHS